MLLQYCQGGKMVYYKKIVKFVPVGGKKKKFRKSKKSWKGKSKKRWY